MKPTLLLGMIGVAITFLVGYHMIYVRQRIQGQLIESQIAQEQADQQMQGEVATLLHRIERYRKRLPPAPDTSWLVREVVAIAQETGVELTSITQEAPQPLQRFTALSISLQFHASYHTLGALVDQIERSDQFLRVEQLGITSLPEDDGTVAVQLTVSTLFVPPAVNLLQLQAVGP